LKITNLPKQHRGGLDTGFSTSFAQNVRRFRRRSFVGIIVNVPNILANKQGKLLIRKLALAKLATRSQNGSVHFHDTLDTTLEIQAVNVLSPDILQQTLVLKQQDEINRTQTTKDVNRTCPSFTRQLFFTWISLQKKWVMVGRHLPS
jgi:hypothetical protein